MRTTDPENARDFAKQVVSRLREAGFESLWAGGCVRDALLGRQPKDYDVATNATPDEISEIFGRRRTLAIGASFGVITVLGPKRAGQIEVATFRRDATYSDGRHPDSVTFSNAREDATRRDFTINGLFYDPIADEVIDYVGGEEDLHAGVVRAIGDPAQRIDEDKLRMLRAVRFATTLGFQLEPATQDAIKQHAAEIKVVSAERITEEMRKILLHVDRRRGIELARDAGLLQVILPELETRWPDAGGKVLAMLQQLEQPTFAVALAVLLRPLERADLVEAVARRWKLSNDNREGILICHEHEQVLRTAYAAPWPTLQRVLNHARIDELLQFTTTVASVLDDDTRAADFCRSRLAEPAEVLNPPHLISGDDLKAAGIAPGPQYRELLHQIRNEQLLGEITSREEALTRAVALAND